jgi:hypothetical protein
VPAEEAQALGKGGNSMYAPSPNVTPLVFRKEIKIAYKCKNIN